ncbi:hypothetical protein [Paraburkholderia sp. BL21I4N1]|uniref:hypothetical protein n=1 Tax=Paraburkholderia sp. BL21I4N1 TaxID=1938801 RepID=UPI0011B270D9|nr:hypothetical protein [Paraburkholderia sp. BL21I4N1]
MLRILQRNPDRIPMERLGEYIRQFAELLGTDNHPVFAGIKKASTGLKAAIPPDRLPYARARLVEAKTQLASKPARLLRSIEDMLGHDSIQRAQLLDSSNNVVYLFEGRAEESDRADRLYQRGTVDGMVTGIVGADDTMHVHLRDHFDRDLKLIIRDEELARELLIQFRNGFVRLHIRGTWQRTDSGWTPEPNKCTVEAFDVLDDTALRDVFHNFASTPDNGWRLLDDPLGEWESLRGLH